MANGFVRLTKTGGGGGGTTSLEVGTTSITNGTVGRVLFQGTGNVLQQSSSLFWNNTNKHLGIGTNTPLGVLHLKEVAQTTRFLIDGDAGQSKIITFRTNGLQRFGLYCNAIAESGSNAGSNFAIRRYNDAGTLLGTPLYIYRNSGNVLINSTIDEGYQLDINGETRVKDIFTTVGTTESDTATLSGELQTTASGTNWSGTNLKSGYTHAQGSAVSLTSTLNAVIDTVYYIVYTLFLDPDTGEGTIDSMTFGGQSILIQDYQNEQIVAVRATTTAALIVTPSSNFNGTVYVTIQSVAESAQSHIYQNSSEAIVGEYRANDSETNVFFGVQAGAFNFDGVRNVFLGYYAGQSNVLGDENTFIGFGAGQSNGSGYNNSFIGSGAGQSNSIGFENTFLGYYAGFANKTGSRNTFIGVEAARNNTSGTDNVSLGYYAGRNNTTGTQNTFIGTNAGQSNSTGANNTFVGYYAGLSNTNGSNNTFIGLQAGRQNSGGSQNTLIGISAGYASSSTNSTVAIGYAAGFSNTSAQNTFVGTEAGYNNSLATANTYLGYRAGYGSNSAGSNNTYVGNSIGATQSSAYQNAIIGTFAAQHILTTNNMVAIGYQAARYFGNLSSNNTGGGNTGVYVGGNARPLTNSTSNEIAIGNDVAGLGSNTAIVGNSSITLTALRGSVIIGATVVNAAAILQADSTTKGFLPPRMDTAQKNAISSPPSGLIIYDTTLNKLCVRTSSKWETITSA